METTRISIDFGTSHTVAVLSMPGREPRPLLFDGSPLLPSAVYAAPDGRLVVGRDAWHAGASNPAGLEPHPKRRVDEDRLLLDGHEVPVEAVFAAVLRHVSLAAGHVDHATLTYPASWAGVRRARLESAARTVFGSVSLIAEPVAAAYHHLAHNPVTGPGQLLVYDLGAGTFDASVLAVSEAGVELVASTGLDDAGGLDIDAAIVEHLGETLAARDPERWRRLSQPADRADQRARRQLWDNVRTAKEVLSRTATTIVHIPLFDEELPLGRERLDALARPILERTVVVSRDLSAAARSGPLLGVFLVGGASRMPLVHTLLHQALGIAPTAADQPELAVAEGALADRPASTESWPTVPVTTPIAAYRPRRRRWIAVAVVLATVIAASAGIWFGTRDREQPLVEVQESPSPTPSPTPSPSPSSLIDSCLVGTWVSTSYSVINFVNTVPTTFRSNGGSVKTIRADGTFEHDYDRSDPRRATFNGTPWTQVVRGRLAGTVRTSNGTTVYSGSGRGYGEFFENGRSRGRSPLTLAAAPSTYLCDPDTMTEYTDDWRVDYKRR